jgi:hypothetical protein
MRKLRRLLLNDAVSGGVVESATAVPRASLRWRIDWLIAIILALLAGVMSYRNGVDFNPDIYHWAACDVYFDADTPRTLLDMTGRMHDHYRTRVHPLFPLLTIPPEKVLEKGLGISDIAAARAVIACTAALWAAGLFALLRLMGLRRLDAIIFACMGMASAASIMWFVLPDTYPLGSLSILAAMLVVALTRWRPVKPVVAIAVSAFTLAITITNYMAGLAMAVCAYPMRRAIVISLAAIVVMLALWCVEKALMPSVRFPLSDKEESKYMLLEQSGGPVRIVSAFFLHTMVVPEPAVRPLNLPGQWESALTVQHVNPGAGSAIGFAGACAWAVLLVIGCLALVVGAGDARFRAMLALVLTGQLGLHLIYGAETFIYALHFAPLLIALAALAALTRLRPIVLILALAVTALSFVNNLEVLRRCKAFINGPHVITPDVPSP